MDEELQLEREKMELERMRMEIEKEKQDPSKEELLLELLKENWAHGRHVESERLDFTSIYVAIVGGTLAFIGGKFDSKNMSFISLFLLIFSILGFQLSRKWGEVFDRHMGKVKNITKDLSSDTFDGAKYIELQNYDSKMSFIKNIKRTKNLFNGFYVLMMLLWSTLLIVSIYTNISYYLKG